MSGSFVVRLLRDVADFRQAEELQRRVWGFVDVEVVPLHLLVTAHKNGGLILGAFPAERSAENDLIGMVFGFPGHDPLGPKHCSHLLGVIPEAHGRGLGTRLKWGQRERLLSMSVPRATWTFDPLMAGNAYLNLHKLGAECSRYHVDLYGEIRDALNRGLATDRFEVDWWLASDRVEQRASGTIRPTPGPIPPEATASRSTASGFRAPTGWTIPGARRVLVEIPSDFLAVKRHDLELARAWRHTTRDAFTGLFDAGYVASDVIRREDRSFYVLTRDPSS